MPSRNLPILALCNEAVSLISNGPEEEVASQWEGQDCNKIQRKNSLDRQLKGARECMGSVGYA